MGMRGSRVVPSFEEVLSQSRMPSAIQSGPSYSSIGAAGGGKSVTLAALDRMAGGLIQTGLETQAEQARKEATDQANIDAENAFTPDGRPKGLAVRGDGTIYGQAYDKAIVTGFLARLDLNSSKLAERLSFEHPDDPKTWKSKWDQEGVSWVATLPADMQPNARLAWEQKGFKELTPINHAFHVKELGEINATLIESMNKSETDAASAFRLGRTIDANEARAKWAQTLDARTDLSPQQKEKLKLGFEEESRKQSSLGGLDRALKKGVSPAEQYLKTFMNTDQPDMHPDERDKLGHVMAARIQDRAQEIEKNQHEAAKAAEQKRARWFSDFEISLHRGEKNYSDIEAAYQSGSLKPQERTAFVTYLDKRREKEAEALSELARVNAAFTGEGLPLDPKSDKDRKAVDNYFAAASQNWQGLAPNEVRARAIRYAAQPGIGILPSPVRAEIRGWLRAGTPEQKVEAANTLAEIRTANPQLLNDLAEEDLAMGNLIGDYAASGVRPEEAVRLAEEGLRVPKADREARGGQYADLAKKYPPADYLTKEANGSWLYRHTLGSNPQVPPEMAREFDGLAKTEFQRHGNWDAARKTAADSLRRVWGVSSLGGGTKWMRGAPESFYGVPDMDLSDNAKWMREQLSADMVASGGMFDPSEGPLEGRALVVPDPYGRTDRTTGLPLYSVMLKSADGVLNPVLDVNGKPMPWRPDWNSSPEAKRRKDDLAKKVDDARAKRNDRGSFPMIGEAP